MPKMTHRGTTRMNRNRNCRAERRSAWPSASALRPAERCSALQTPDPSDGTSHEPTRLLAREILEIAG